MRRRVFDSDAASSDRVETGFPETRTDVLARAAGGDWDPFFRDYLAACLREIVIACRMRGCRIDDADELLQELVVQMMKEGRSRQPSVDGVRGNVPDRFLKNREAAGRVAMFRTVLKRVIQNLIAVRLRRQRRAAKDAVDVDRVEEPWLVESISVALDRQEVRAALAQAALRLREECETGRTRGRRQAFRAFVLASTSERTTAAIAADLGLDRGTVADSLKEARQRFVAILQELTGIGSIGELKKHVAAQPDAFLEALKRADEVAPRGDDV